FELDAADRPAAAGAVDQPYDRDAQIARHHFGAHLLFLQPPVGGAAAHGEVVAGDDDGTSIERTASHHEVRRHERGHVARVVVFRLARDAADLAERAGIEELVDALAHRELAGVLVALHAFG